MRTTIETLPIAHEKLGEMIRGQEWGGMTSAYMQYPTGLDFCPLLEGLERDHCQCPHWGYVMEGRIRVNYEDGTEEVVGAGEIYYWPSGHTVVVEADSGRNVGPALRKKKPRPRGRGFRCAVPVSPDQRRRPRRWIRSW